MDRIKSLMGCFLLWFIPEEYRVKYRILKHLRSKHLMIQDADMAYYKETISVTVDELAQYKGLTKENINQYYIGLARNNEIFPLTDNKDRLQSMHIEVAGIQAVGENRYFWDGLNLARNRFILIVGSIIAVATIIYNWWPSIAKLITHIIQRTAQAVK